MPPIGPNTSEFYMTYSFLRNFLAGPGARGNVSEIAARPQGRRNLLGDSLFTLLLFWPLLFKYRAEAPFVVRETIAVFLGKLGDLCLAIFLGYRPDALQLILVNSAVAILASLQSESASD